ncbi:MAG: 3-deoxy-8-phosphooctulonate synthase [Acidobacteria bacterium]|nr:3-deoxy-8-phosphooctulonate synthase [Acidobacteriota bacterium]
MSHSDGDAGVRPVQVGEHIVLGDGRPPVFVAGPCVIESAQHCLHMAREIAAVAREIGVPVIFKASFDKANRSALSSYRGPGLNEGLAILKQVKETTGLPVLSDIHAPEQAAPAAEVLDVLQIPALLCRQTDLLQAAGDTGKPVNLKKGQFMAPWDMVHAVEKIRATGNRRIILTERGTIFGYNNLVVDMRSLAILRDTGCPVVFDATHAVQLPGGAGARSSGQPRFIEVLARAAAAAGMDGLFTETHDQPEQALSDGANALPLQRLAPLMRQITAIAQLAGKQRA